MEGPTIANNARVDGKLTEALFSCEEEHPEVIESVSELLPRKET